MINSHQCTLLGIYVPIPQEKSLHKIPPFQEIASESPSYPEVCLNPCHFSDNYEMVIYD